MKRTNKDRILSKRNFSDGFSNKPENKDFFSEGIIKEIVRDIYRQSNGGWAQWFNSLSIMLLILDENETVITCNEAFRKYVRIPKNKIQGKSFCEIIFKNKTKSKSTADIKNLYLKEHTQKIILANKSIKVTADPILNPENKIKYIIVTVIDITENLQNIFNLESEKNKFQDLVDMANVAIVSDDKDGKFIYFNKQFAEMFGYTETEIATKTHADLVHPDDLKMIAKIHNDRFKGENSVAKYEFRALKKDGSIINIEIYVTEISKQNNEIIGTRSFLRDITVNVKRERDLNERIKELDFLHLIAELSGKSNTDFDNFFKEISNSLPNAMQYPLLNSVIIEINNKLYQSSNFNDSKIYKKIDIKVRDKKVGYFKVCINQNVQNKAPYFLKEEIELLNTLSYQITEFLEKKYLEQLSKVQNNIANAVSVHNNLEELIQTIKNEVSTIIDTTNFYIAFYDKETDMISIPYYADQEDDIVRFEAKNTLTGYVIKKGKPMLVNADVERQLYKQELIESIGGKSKIWLGVPLSIKGEVIGAFVVQNYENEDAYNEKDLELLAFISHQIANSIDRQKSIEALEQAKLKAEESDKLKTAFLNNLSHEVRTPLNGILGFSKLLIKPDLNDQVKGKYINIIDTSSSQLMNIIEDLILISEIQTNQVTILDENIILAELLYNVFHSFKSKFEAKRIDFTMDLNDDVNALTINSDKYKITDILNRLLSNALKFTDNGHVRLSVSLNGLEILFSIEDTGIGIEEELKEKIFIPFRQADLEQSRVFEGNGLGLSIAKGYTEILGGKIWVKSTVKKGSIFYFTVPFNSTCQI